MNIKPKQIDLSHIKTPEQLLDFITSGGKENKNTEPPKLPCPGCGLTIEEFDVKGRFGCGACYEHFTERMEQLVYPYHKAESHAGKIPKKYLEKKCNSTVEEKTKLLKLQLAKAIELEEYEKATEIKTELGLLLQEPPSVSEGQ